MDKDLIIAPLYRNECTTIVVGDVSNILLVKVRRVIMAKGYFKLDQMKIHGIGKERKT
jgi:hypothetical protein